MASIAQLLTFLSSEGTPSLSPTSDDTTVDEVVSATVSTLAVTLGTAIGVVVGLVLAFLFQGFLTYLARRKPNARTITKAVSRPIKLLLASVGAWVGMGIAWAVPAGSDAPHLRNTLEHIFLILVILASTWLIAAFVDGIEKTVLRQMQNSGASRFRKAQTQMQILHRILMVAIWILGLALVLMTFPAAKSLGTTLFTSASLLSVVVGIAAQSTLGNVFAGLQLAFSDSIRMGDIVVWEKEFTTVEEITLTYVVLKVWDGRRLIVPSSQMTTKTFENWTRRTPDLLGYVDFDLDWKVPIARMRAELNSVLEKSDLWDGDTGILQVRDASSNRLQISVLLSAENAGKLTDLKYYVRERLVRWIQENAPEAVPRSRSLTGSESNSLLLEHTDSTLNESGDTLVPRNTSSTPSSSLSPHQPNAVVNEILIPTSTQGHTDKDTDKTAVIDMSKLGIEGPRRVPVDQRSEESETPGQAPGHESSIFTGSHAAELRGKEFSGPGEDVLRERENSLRKAKDESSAKDSSAGNNNDAASHSSSHQSKKERGGTTKVGTPSVALSPASSHNQGRESTATDIQ